MERGRVALNVPWQYAEVKGDPWGDEAQMLDPAPVHGHPASEVDQQTSSSLTFWLS